MGQPTVDTPDVDRRHTDQGLERKQQLLETAEVLFAELVRTMRQQLRRAQAAAMDPRADALSRIRQGSMASLRFMAEHRAYFTLLDVERSEPTLAEVLRDGSDVYAADVVRLIIEAQADGTVAPGDPQLHAVGVLGAVSSFSHALRNGAVDVDVDTLAEAVGDWVVGGLTAR